MNKQTIRPLLVEQVEKTRRQEAEAYRLVQSAPEDWEGLARVQEAWAATRLKRVQAELLLWLADRQWETEEREAHLLEAEARLNASRSSKT